ncbi:MAG TPA: hypothetical protein PKY20_05420 [Methanothrix sp.]|nr:hypothetical protein [Methanothrix sp.]HOU70538.1 hypothetical protein [Methanothrix sp.]HQE97622.1 hypothetical protein [Methanothrix sp.]HQJ79708.1 hypothetical protein [Methanothrix sp.]HUM80529.1 hypothetical protein [Methanothrix sp.]
MCHENLRLLSLRDLIQLFLCHLPLYRRNCLERIATVATGDRDYPLFDVINFLFIEYNNKRTGLYKSKAKKCFEYGYGRMDDGEKGSNRSKKDIKGGKSI